jgi:hypothetical protein
MIPKKKGAEGRWRKSSYSGGESGNCVEVDHAPSYFAVRDSKNANGPVLKFSRRQGAAFIAAAKAGRVLTG